MTQNDLTDLVVGACQVDASAATYFYQMGNIGALTDNGAGDFSIALDPAADSLEHQYDLTLISADPDVTGCIEFTSDTQIEVHTATANTGVDADIDFQLVIRKIRRVA